MADDMYSKIMDELLKAAGSERGRIILTQMQFKLAVSDVEIKVGKIRSQLGLSDQLEADIWRQMSQS